MHSTGMKALQKVLMSMTRPRTLYRLVRSTRRACGAQAGVEPDVREPVDTVVPRAPNMMVEEVGDIRAVPAHPRGAARGLRRE